MVLPRQGKWQLEPSRSPSNASLGVLEVDFPQSTGTLRQAGQPASPLTAVTQISATRFTASYNTGRFHGSLEGEIRDDGTLDVKFRGNQNADCKGVPVALTDPGSAPADSDS